MHAARIVGASLALLLAACGGGGGGGSLEPSPNQPPTADAGPDQATTSGSTVTLTSRGTDPDGSPAVFTWTQTAGPPVTLGASANPVFCAPVVATPTVLTFSLTVTDNGGLSSAPDTMNVTVSPHPGGNATVNGRVTFARVPLGPPGTGLNYAIQSQAPARGITVELVCVGQILATATTDASGDYSASVPANISLAARAVAELRRPASPSAPQWHMQVRDLDAGASPYTFTGAIFDSTAQGGAQNVAIPSGWDATGTAAGARAAAPFAILDTIYKAIQLVLSVEPAANFPPLTVDWSTNNPGGIAFFSGGSSPKIVLPGEVNVDTDEYDEHVIAHEFGHFVEATFSRSDSIGGPHTVGDLLDMRVAFGEGYGYAFGAMVLGQPLTRDTFGQRQSQESRFDIEGNNWQNEGWFSEASNWSILWDLFDDTPADDPLVLGFQPLWDVLTSEQRTNNALTSIFTFITALKAAQSQDTQIDQIVSAQSIGSPSITAYGDGEMNSAGGGSDVLPIYTTIAIDGGSPQPPVRSVASVGGINGTGGNKLSNHRFLRLNVANPQNVRFVVDAPTGRDADIIVYRHGTVVGSGQGQSDENFVVNLQPGEYVLDVYDCENAECNEQSSYNYQPTDITVTVTSN